MMTTVLLDIVYVEVIREKIIMFVCRENEKESLY